MIVIIEINKKQITNVFIHYNTLLAIQDKNNQQQITLNM